MIPYRLYRVALNILARSIRALMKLRGVDGTFCVSGDSAYYEWKGMRFVYNYSNFGVGGDIDAGGSTEPQTRAKLNEFLNEQSVFYDIGAHEGLFTLSVRKYAPGIEVHAFEPHAAALIKNLSINDVQDVHVYQVAVGDQSGFISMTTRDRSSNHVESNSGDIPMVTIDDLNLPPPTAMKLDIEGFEFHALRGARLTLLRHRPVVIAEINHCFTRYNLDLIPFYEYMRSIGYALHSLQAGKLSLIDQQSPSVNQLRPSDESNYWWLPI